MATRSRTRYRIVLVEEPAETLPVRYRRRRAAIPFVPMDPMETLMEAFLRLSFRSEGNLAWAPALTENPITFLLDAVGDGVVIRTAQGRMVYANPAARLMGLLEDNPPVSLEFLQMADQQYERRSMSFRARGELYVVEVLRKLD